MENIFITFHFILFNSVFCSFYLFVAFHCLNRVKKKDDMIFAFANYMKNNSKKNYNQKKYIEKNCMRTRKYKEIKWNETLFYAGQDYECEFVMQALTVYNLQAYKLGMESQTHTFTWLQWYG